MDLSDSQYYHSSQFIKEVKNDPNWLLTCLTSLEHTLNPHDNITAALWRYSARLGCHRYPKVQSETLTIIKWLEEMRDAGEPVKYSDIPSNCFSPRAESCIEQEWRKYWLWLETGDYTYNAFLCCQCSHPVLAERFEEHLHKQCVENAQQQEEQHGTDSRKQERMKKHQQYQERITKEVQREKEVA